MLSVVIPTCERPAKLGRVLTALRNQQHPPPYEVLVVNDASHDDAYASVLTPHHSTIEYIQLSKRGGPARARNAGVRRASGQTIVFTDDDCIPPPKWLSSITAAMSEHALDVVGGPALPHEGECSSVVERYLAASGFLQCPILVEGSLACLPTANLAVARDALEEVGGFDERFHRPGGEDTDLLYRLKHAGYRAAFVPSMTTFHDARCGLRSLLTRYYNYGYGVGQHLTYRSLTLDYGLLYTRSWLGLIPRVPELIRWAVTTPRHREFSRSIPRLTRAAFRILAIFVELAYQIGGVDGLRFAPIPQAIDTQRCPSNFLVPMAEDQ